MAGAVLVDHDGGQLRVEAGQSVVTRAGERIRYSTGSEGAEYVAVCLPAFSPRHGQPRRGGGRVIFGRKGDRDTPTGPASRRPDRPGAQGAAARPPRRWGPPRRRSSRSPTRSGMPTCRPPTPRASARGSGRVRTPVRWCATSRRSTTPWRSCRPPTACAGSPASACSTWPPTASSMPRAATRPSSTCRPGSRSRTSSRPSTPGSARGRQEAAKAGTPIRVTALLTAMRHAAKSTEIAELAVALPRPRGRRVRHRRGRGGLPAHPAPRRVRVPASRERPLHHPRR